MNLKLDLDAGPHNVAAYKKYIGGPGVAIPAVALVDYEGNLIAKPPLQQVFEPENFVRMMENTLKVEAELQSLKTRIKSHPDDPQMNAELALIYLNRRDFEKGIRLAERSFTLDSKNESGLLPALHIKLGLYYGDHVDNKNAQDYFQKAETHFQTVIQKYSQSEDYEPAQYYLGVTYAIQEKYEKAIATLTQLQEATNPTTRELAMQVLQQIRAQASEK